MTRDFAHGFLEELFAGRNLMPGRGPGGMWKRNEVEVMVCALDTIFATDCLFELGAIDELSDGQSAYGNYETRFQDSNLVVHPGRTVEDFIGGGNAIATAHSFAWETSANGGEINCRSDTCFVYPAKFFEPPEQRFAGGVRKRSFQDGFTRPGGLSDQHYLTENRSAGDRRGSHAGTTPALH
jgi:hypothetical protein